MPPLNEYIFESIGDPVVRIFIESDSLEQAFYILTFTTKHPADFKLVESK